VSAPASSVFEPRPGPGAPVYVVDGARTPFLKARTGPGPFSASDLAVAAGRQVLARMPFEARAIDEVVLGATMPSPDEANIGRVVALRLGCGDATPAYTVMRNCASGMQALDSGAAAIRAGRASLVLAGGTDAMSRAPVLFGEAAVGWLGRLNAARTTTERLKAVAAFRPGMLRPEIGLVRGLTDPICGLNMGQTAEELATRFDIPRERMDAYAVRSHQRLAAAQEAGTLNDEIVPVFDRRGRCHERDDGVRPDASVDRLARLKPVFDRDFGRVTAGNSAQITDGAAMLVLAGEDAVRAYDLPVLGRLVDCAWAGLDPRVMGLGPVYASAALMSRHGLALDAVDAWEINEAFAAQVLACLDAFDSEDFCRDTLGLSAPVGRIDEARVNVDGGGVSLGHPVGSSGARIVLHLFRVLARTGGRTGIATLCIGGGQGGAMLLERAAGAEPE